MMPAVTVSLLVLASLILGFLRDGLVAYFFGADWHADLYFLALLIPIFIENSLAVGVRDTLVAAFIREREGASGEYRQLAGQTGVLVLAAGAGEVGKQMVLAGQRIPFSQEQSLVARAARTRRGVIANDVRLAPDFLPNPMLPATRAEMAVPMIVGSRLLGVFDVQSDAPDRFTGEDLRIHSASGMMAAAETKNTTSGGALK